MRWELLFERFLTPDRDSARTSLDIESERREDIIQHVYSQYGRGRAAQVANVITCRGPLCRAGHGGR